MNDPLVSIILPTYNSKHEWITLSIESILRQEYKNFELLMVDDASTNGFLEKMQDLIASDPRITLIQNSKNLGLSDSYNTGIKQSH